MSKTLHILASTLLLTSTLCWAKDDISQDEAHALRERGAILPLEKIIHTAQQLHPGRIAEVELKHKRNRYIYEIEMIDSKGQVWEMKIDASNGALISQEQDD